MITRSYLKNLPNDTVFQQDIGGREFKALQMEEGEQYRKCLCIDSADVSSEVVRIHGLTTIWYNTDVEDMPSAKDRRKRRKRN